MFLKKIKIHKYKIFENLEIDLEKNDKFPNVFSIAGVNGSGKSILLQFIFTMLHCFMDPNKRVAIRNLLDGIDVENKDKNNLAEFTIRHKEIDYNLKFFFSYDDMNIDTINNSIIIYNDLLSRDSDLLFLETDMSKDLLEILSKKVFLISPNSQIHHFLKEATDVKISKKDIDNFFTYNLLSTEMILNTFEKSFVKDRKEKLLTGKYGSYFDSLTNELNNFLEEKSIIVNAEISKIFFKLTNDDTSLSLTDLSHGELKKLAIFIWLKYSIMDEESIILMDEIDIALHPKWQYDIVEELSKWTNKKNQFFLATHSPQILSSIYYKNLILLDKKMNKTKIIQPENISTDNDINTILQEIMGASKKPPELEKLHFEYRKLVESGKKDIDKEKKLEKEILKWESSDSAFFQRTKMYLRFKK